jgi:hypothetical protein
MPEGTSGESSDSKRLSKNYSSITYRLATVPTLQLSRKSLIPLEPNHFKYISDEKPSTHAPLLKMDSLFKSKYSETSFYSSIRAQPKIRDSERTSVKTHLIDLNTPSSPKKTAYSFKSQHNSSTHGHTIPRCNLSVPLKTHISNDRKTILQEYLASLLSSRGYSNQHYPALEGGYFCKPTEYQRASYGMKLLQAVRTSNITLVDKMLKGGVSQNPCNAYGESIIHMICRRGDHELLKVFLKHGCCVQICDDFGRTPFHDACWTSKVSP